MGPPAPEPVVVYRTRFHSDCEERALVLRAVGIPHEMMHVGGEFYLVVDSGDAATAALELERYSHENHSPPQRVEPLPKQSEGWTGVFVYGSVLLLGAIMQTRSIFAIDWVEAGSMNSELVRGGEWWRTVTALTLHADLWHLLANLVFGAVFGLFAAQLLGTGLAWSSILAAGALGNAMNALIQAPGHSAVGASTAVFAALGVLSAYSWMRRKHIRRWAYRWGPIVGGVLLLAYIGTGDERTDIVAHLTGFISGFGLGTLYGALDTRLVLKPRMQIALGGAALVLIALAWALAIHRWMSSPL